MSQTELISAKERSIAGSAALAGLDRLARRAVFSILSRLPAGQIRLQEDGVGKVFGRITDDFPVRATVTVHDPRFYRMTALGGSIGAAEAYMAGFWSADDLTAVIRIFTRSQQMRESVESGLARVTQPAHALVHFLRKNTPKGSRENIVAHYDLGNDFYRLFLDETLTYSCGIFRTENSTLKEASEAKYDRLCKKIALTADDHVLEIGTGWGGFALHAVKHYGCRVTTTTISDEQHRLAAARFAEAGITDRITLLQKDYRDLSGTYDKLVSIEMIEAVGHHFLDSFFDVCSNRLKDDGVMALQAITIADHVFDRHKHEVDFIKRYIFPGSCIPSVAAMLKSIAKKTDLRLFHLEDITPHYAITLRRWRENFFANIDRVRAMGFSEAFIRMWEYYLCYCEGGFAERYIGDVQMILTKPLSRALPILPPIDSGPRPHSR
ncbi:MAG: cyclopropane-fatty-acyl-phospholipid synthase family protein [Desulfobacterales bacterium]|jgi:cyclopropane-fatty-acyl-phospholipid synthase